MQTKCTGERTTQTRSSAPHNNPIYSHRWLTSPLPFALGILILGMMSAWLGFLLTRPQANDPTLPTLLDLPPFFFWMVWIVIYPALGVAVWHIWRLRGDTRARHALLVFGVYLLTNLAFVPLTALIPGIWTAFLLDVIGLVGGVLVAWMFWNSARKSLAWMLPLLIWLPITTINKLPAILELLNQG